MAIEKGTLVRWIGDKGFGFIKPETGKDIFIHISALIGMSRKPIIGDVSWTGSRSTIMIFWNVVLWVLHQEL